MSTKSASRNAKQEKVKSETQKKQPSRKVLKTNDAEDVKEEEARSKRASEANGGRSLRNKSKPAAVKLFNFNVSIVC